jgi:NADP-dependent 3-hydroxy acid dehydrogenase YdfG
MTELSPLVLIAGATSASGTAVARALAKSGARVLAVGRSESKLADLRTADTRVCDVASAADVTELAMRIHHKFGPIDGLVNLVGGWRGGGGIAGQGDDDWAFLETSLTALRLTTRAFYDDLVASAFGRLAIVSSTSIDDPAPGNANYAALKAAAETWTKAVGNGFAKSGAPAAAVIFRVKVLAGLEDRLGSAVAALWTGHAADLNGRTVVVD